MPKLNTKTLKPGVILREPHPIDKERLVTVKNSTNETFTKDRSTRDYPLTYEREAKGREEFERMVNIELKMATHESSEGEVEMGESKPIAPDIKIHMNHLTEKMLTFNAPKRASMFFSEKERNSQRSLQKPLLNIRDSQGFKTSVGASTIGLATSRNEIRHKASPILRKSVKR